MVKSFCSKGIKQSPINIIGSRAKKCSSTCNLSFNYRTSKCNLIYSNKNLLIDYDVGSNVSFNHDIYELDKISFTSPSSHKIDNNNYPLEMHLNHRCNNDGSVLIIAVFLEINEANSLSKMFFEKFEDSIPKRMGDQLTINTSQNWNIFNALPENKAFFFYDGSLPRKPCTENVKWIVMDEPVNCSKIFYKNLKKIIKVNARSLQNLSNRTIFYNINNSEKNTRNNAEALKCYTNKQFANACAKLSGNKAIKNYDFNLKYILITIFVIISVCLILFGIWIAEKKLVKFSIPSIKSMLINKKLINN